ncbi:MAG: sulfatase-like hydrolase/transferase [Planctomycetes bacterium]|nr:sulfatase-like hydrolase/transferase [Planctomycetota bacterium]MBL7041082.1 sulfatase-like hydrolase/transferase [Pirellulaceae bacterium]
MACCVGGKTIWFEGGRREPIIVRWSGRIKAGTITHRITIAMDLIPMCLELAGADSPADDATPARDGIESLFRPFDG